MLGLPDKSLVQAAQTIRSRALLGALGRGARRLTAALGDLRRCIRHTCHLQKRRCRPTSFQLLLDPALQPLR